MKKILFLTLLTPFLISAQTLNFDFALPNFDGDGDNPKVVSFDFSAKAPLLKNDNIKVVAGLSSVYSESADKLGNPYLGFKYSGLPLNLSASAALFIPSASNDNASSLSAFIALQDTRFGHYVPESTPILAGLNSWANLPHGIRGDFYFGGFAIFQGDAKLLSDDSFELALPFSARLSREIDNLETGAAWSGLWYATEDVGDRVLSQLRFDAGYWLGSFKPTVEIAFPLNGDLQSVLDNTIVLKLTTR